MTIELRGVSKIYGNEENRTYALNDVNLEIKAGEMIAIMGPSGSGKSTLLNILGFIDSPTKGIYTLDSVDIKDYNRKKLSKMRNNEIGFVFQYFALMKEYTVLDNVTLPLTYRRMSNKSRKKLASEYLNKLGVGDQAHKKISQLSGGQQQRVAIARAIIGEPNIILADEPTGALDQKTGKEIMEVLSDINKSGKTVIIVTHDLNVAKYCHRIIDIVDGKIREN